jgi:hypothetical protein
MQDSFYPERSIVKYSRPTTNGAMTNNVSTIIALPTIRSPKIFGRESKMVIVAFTKYSTVGDPMEPKTPLKVATAIEGYKALSTTYATHDQNPV